MGSTLLVSESEEKPAKGSVVCSSIIRTYSGGPGFGSPAMSKNAFLGQRKYASTRSAVMVRIIALRASADYALRTPTQWSFCSFIRKTLRGRFVLGFSHTDHDEPPRDFCCTSGSSEQSPTSGVANPTAPLDGLGSVVLGEALPFSLCYLLLANFKSEEHS